MLTLSDVKKSTAELRGATPIHKILQTKKNNKWCFVAMLSHTSPLEIAQTPTKGVSIYFSYKELKTEDRPMRFDLSRN